MIRKTILHRADAEAFPLRRSQRMNVRSVTCYGVAVAFCHGESSRNDRMQRPATLQDSLMALLDRLASAKEAALIAGVVGREFTYTLVTPFLAIRRKRPRNARG
jgi:hypothetical protein